MFRCFKCKESIGPNVSPVQFVIAYREKRYSPRPIANDPGGIGKEIAKEVSICPLCSDKIKTAGQV